ncbi:MAG: adenylosuccinate lyase [Buchnera aphidicola (Eriosoma harunire)]
MNNFFLSTISPIDGRYHNQTKDLKVIFSEYSFLKFRLKIEILWFKKLTTIPQISALSNCDAFVDKCLDSIENNFSIQDALLIKELEKRNNHDVKSVEFFLKDIIKKKINYDINLEFIHFACTSDDINNLSYALMLKETKNKIILMYWEKIINVIEKMVIKYQNIPMLSRTHGQAASPTTMGKEMLNFLYRLSRQLSILKKIQICGKMNGTVGNFNAHCVAYPNINWLDISHEFVRDLGLYWNPVTTQIEPHDYISELLDTIIRFNNILLDLNRDLWGYISINYFSQKVNQQEVGSSIMPHKINPIDFENSEGNLGISNAIMKHISSKLLISRWQRDLSDSTVLRNLGVAISYSVIAYQSTILGLNKIKLNTSILLEDLNNHWEILSEPIQTVMRKYNIINSYDILKKYVRGRVINKQLITDFIDHLSIPEEEKIKLKQLTPQNYLGYSSDFINKFL